MDLRHGFFRACARPLFTVRQHLDDLVRVRVIVGTRLPKRRQRRRYAIGDAPLAFHTAKRAGPAPDANLLRFRRSRKS